MRKQRPSTLIALVVGLAGIACALALPFAPVITHQATVTWPAAGEPATSTSAIFVPYRPTELTATVPCRPLRGGPGIVLETAPVGDGLMIRNSARGPELLVDDETVSLAPLLTEPGADCTITVDAGSDGVTAANGTGSAIELADEPVPKVFGFRTDLDSAQAAGLSVTASTASVFGTSPTTLKMILIVGQLIAAAVALTLLLRTARFRRPSLRRWHVDGVDAAVIVVLAGWAIVGPLAVDDGWATTIARNVAATGEAGNYFRWWNASETPFAFWPQLLSPLTTVGLAPLWLRVPSTLLGVATWFALSRGVLGAALPGRARTTGARLLAAVALLVAWLPYNLGIRPESYVAFALTALLAILWRARRPAALGMAAVVAALTLPISPTSVLLAAPVIVFAPRVVAILRKASAGPLQMIAWLLLLTCLAGISLTIVFADATWDALITATDWHQFFGPTLPWHTEPYRYQFLLSEGQQGSFAKRMPIALTAAMLLVVALLSARSPRGRIAGSAIRLGAVVIIGVVLLTLAPSKWSYYFGAMAGLFASFLVIAVVLITDQARSGATDRRQAVIGLAGGVAVAAAVTLAFAGRNAWWLPHLYFVPGDSSAIPILDSPLLWFGVLVVGYAVARGRRAGLIAGPAVLTVLAASTSVALLLFSFVGAPLRRPAASLAAASLSRCGAADDIEVLQDGAILTPAGSESLNGFVAQAGFANEAPPPDPPGTGMSTYLWGSRGAPSTASMTSQWFTLPALGEREGLTISLSGRSRPAGDIQPGAGADSTLAFEFGRADGPQAVQTLGDVSPSDSTPSDADLNRALWRAVGVDASQVPAGADRVRIRAEDSGGGADEWLAFTGPRRHSVIGLSTFLDNHGPVLVTWPMAFLFPCVTNIPRIEGGIAQTPQAVIVSPGPWFGQQTDQALGGGFAALALFGRPYEVPTRVIGDPDLDWGTLLLHADESERDEYDVHVTDVRRPGHVPDRSGYQVDLPTACWTPPGQQGYPPPCASVEP